MVALLASRDEFIKGTIEFLRDDIPVCLRVVRDAPREVSLRSASLLLLHLEAAHVFELVQLPPDSSTAADGAEFPAYLPPPILGVLEELRSVLQVPSGMPSARPFDHRIHLLPNSKPVNVRPYRYPYFQKTEIERQVKDGSFRFCIDDRALNFETVLDHFPIPTTDELFDELGAARVFTKLDLRAGYH